MKYSIAVMIPYCWIWSDVRSSWVWARAAAVVPAMDRMVALR